MNSFTAASAALVIFKPGSLDALPQVAASLTPDSSSVLVLTDLGVVTTGAPTRAVTALQGAGYKTVLVDNVPPEPTDTDIDRIAAEVRSMKASLIVAIGGGSVIDTAKVISVLALSDRSTASLVDQGVPTAGIPLIVVPTTAGTGSEATPNAIVLFPQKNLKVGIISTHFIPARVLLDPALTTGLPRGLTASTGVDALCHLLECFVGKKANPFSDMYAREGLRLLLPGLPIAYNNGMDLEARSAVMLAAYYGGVCIASSGTTAVHALSYPLGGKYHIPHGVANAALLLPVLDFQKRLIAPRLAQAAAAAGLTCSGDNLVDATALVENLRDMLSSFGIPLSLAELDVPESAIDGLTEAAFGVRRLLDNNPVDLSREDIRSIYESMR